MEFHTKEKLNWKMVFIESKEKELWDTPMTLTIMESLKQEKCMEKEGTHGLKLETGSKEPIKTM